MVSRCDLPRGLVNIALYTLLCAYCIYHLVLRWVIILRRPIAIFSYFLLKRISWQKCGACRAVILPACCWFINPWCTFLVLSWLADLGITSAIVYLTVNRLTKYYDARVIVLSFLPSGFIVPLCNVYSLCNRELSLTVYLLLISGCLQVLEWFYVLLMGLAALFGQYFVTRSYGADKAGIVSIFGYANIIYFCFYRHVARRCLPDWIHKSAHSKRNNHPLVKGSQLPTGLKIFLPRNLKPKVIVYLR